MINLKKSWGRVYLKGLEPRFPKGRYVNNFVVVMGG